MSCLFGRAVMLCHLAMEIRVLSKWCCSQPKLANELPLGVLQPRHGQVGMIFTGCPSSLRHFCQFLNVDQAFLEKSCYFALCGDLMADYKPTNFT